MQNINLNEKWIMLTQEPNNLFVEPNNGDEISFPYDANITKERLFSLESTSSNGYYPSAVTYFFKRLPNLDSFSCVSLALDGLCGQCDIYIGGVYVDSTSSRVLHYIDITDFYKQDEVIVLRISSSCDTSKYVGNGIAGGISLSVAKEDYYIENGSVKVDASMVEGKGALEVFANVVNDGETQYAYLYTEIYNQKNKRITKRGKRIKLIAGKTKTYSFKIRLARAFEWTQCDPYTYSTKVCVKPLETEFDPEYAIKTTFGIADHSIAGKSYRIGGKQTKLKGVVLTHDNGFVGCASLASAEARKLSAIKQMGYNAVRYIGCPTQTTLDTLDKLGLVCVVDIFDTLLEGFNRSVSHDDFKRSCTSTIKNSITALRNHPCVAFYSVANDASETFGRGDGYDLIQYIIEIIKFYDSKTFITGNAIEREILPSELAKFNIKFNAERYKNNVKNASIEVGKEKDVFGKLTAPYFEMLDVAGYTNLSDRFASDIKSTGNLVMALSESGSDLIKFNDIVNRTVGVIGGFIEYGADFIGSDKSENSEVKGVNTSGCLDFTLRRKTSSYLNEIVNGGKHCSYMMVQDPNTAQSQDSSEHALWNWHDNVGHDVKVVVYTSGEIVALYQDGTQIARKIAGKMNNHKAEFIVNYTPGKLEAVSFHKGFECSRCGVETTLQPKVIKLETVKKTVLADSTFYVDIRITDKKGKLVSNAMRPILVEIEGEGELIAIGNSDPTNDLSYASSCFLTNDGYASMAIKAKNNGKMFIKVSSDGLRMGKMTIKVK